MYISYGSPCVKHTENSLRILRRIVTEEPCGKDVACIPRNGPGERTVVEVGVGRDALLEAVLGPLGHQVQGERSVVAVFIGHPIPLHEAGHVEAVVVPRHVEVVTGVGRVGFDDIVGANETAGRS
jgi:hypothetical protein